MHTLIFFIFILLIVIAMLTVALARAHKEDVAVKTVTNLDRIISLFESDVELTNTEIRKALGVSARTAVRYMDELEKAGLVVQTRKTGPLTAYVLKK
jgi:predicted ArsR family transcriptional regulator